MTEYILVPREPTEEMLRDGHAAYMRGDTCIQSTEACYRAMLSAAPSTPIPPVAQTDVVALRKAVDIETHAKEAWELYCDLLEHTCDDDHSLRDGYIDGWQDGYEARFGDILQLHKDAVNTIVSWQKGEITQDDAAKVEAKFRDALAPITPPAQPDVTAEVTQARIVTLLRKHLRQKWEYEGDEMVGGKITPESMQVAAEAIATQLRVAAPEKGA